MPQTARFSVVASSKSRQEEAGGQPAATSAVRAAILPALCSVDYRQAVRRSQRAADVVRLCLMPRRNDRARQLHTEEECDGKTSTRRRISNRVARPPSSDEHEKPSERKTREKAEAIRRARKAARKQAQREGLIPMPKRREPAPRRAPLPRF